MTAALLKLKLFFLCTKSFIKNMPKNKIFDLLQKGCLFRIPDPDFYPSRIQQQHQKRRGKFFLSYHFCNHKYHKMVKSFIFEQAKKNLLAKTLRIIIFFLQKFVIKQSKLWVWDLRSGTGKNLSQIQGQKGTGFRIRIRNTDLSLHSWEQLANFACRTCAQWAVISRYHLAWYRK